MGREIIASLDMQGGINTAAPRLSDASFRRLDEGTWNSIVSGDGFTRPWSGATTQGTGSGSPKMLPVGKTWGGIKATNYSDRTWSTSNVNIDPENSVRITNHGYSTGQPCQLTTTGTLPAGLALATTYYIIRRSNASISFAASLSDAFAGIAVPITSIGSGTGTVDVAELSVPASGSFVLDIGNSRWGIGSGLPHIEGTNVSGFTLSTNLQVQVATLGVYGTPFQAGLAQPSAPEVGITETPGSVSNSVSAKVERMRPSTGANSVASPTSEVVSPLNGRVRVTYGEASTGQTHWRQFFTFHGFGGTGVHYLASYDGMTEIPEELIAASTIDGIPRSLEFNFKDGDLIPIRASFDDYPPPAGTHLLRIGTVMCIVGCYADTASLPTTTSPGTCIAVSKENNYESYVPTSLLYLPEPAVDVLSRPIDDYGFVACENSIHAIQYVGDRGDGGPSCTLTTILPDIGIAHPHNWAQFRGMLALYSSQGQLLIMDQSGEFDTEFTSPVSKILKGFAVASTVIGYDPPSDSLIVANGSRILVYSFQARQWRQIWLPDYNISGNVTSCITAKRQLYFTVDNGGVLTAYSYDTGSASPGLSFCSNYQAPSGAGVVDICELAIAAETSISTPLAVAINRNLRKTVFRRIGTTASNTTINDAENSFAANMVSRRVVLFGPNIGGSGIDYIQTTVATFVNAGQITLANAPLATLSNCLMFFGDWVGVIPSINSARHLQNMFPNVPELRSFQIAVYFKASGNVGNVLSIDVIGTQYASNRAV